MSTRIGIGLGRFEFESIADFRSWLAICEDSEIDSIWQSDQVVSSQFAPEPMAMLSVIAGATQRLKFGTNAIVLPFRDPITFARQCATLDYLSDGRFLPTVAIGRGEAAEWEATGRSPKGRGARADEALEVITRLWREKPGNDSAGANFDGEFFSLHNARINPTPKQDPLPLWLGGSSKAAIRRTARFGTGWLAPLQTPDETATTVEAIRKESRRIDRPIPDDHYGATILYRIGGAPEAAPAPNVGDARTPPDDRRRKLARISAVGDAGVVIDLIREFEKAGVSKFIAIPLVQNRAELMEQTRRLNDEVLPYTHP